MIRKDGVEEISVKDRARLLSLNRSSLYYRKREIGETDSDIMKILDKINLYNPCYGSRRLRVMLHNHGFFIGRDHTRRLMRLMRIHALYPRKRTSIPNKEHRIYPYLLRDLSIDRPNQVWCTDITYIPLAKGFLYLVAVMDWNSRMVLSWRLSTTLDSAFCIEALKEALQKYGCPEIFNSDQGCQFTSHDFTAVLIDKGIKISMDGKGRVYDNIFIERLWRSLKQEEVYINAYESIKACREGIGSYFSDYNTKRPHQSLDYLTPGQVYYNGLERQAC